MCKTSQRARLASATGRCKTCKESGELIACSFCTTLYHNSPSCLPVAQHYSATVLPALAASACYPWACPTCFKKGMASVQRTVLKPTGQQAAGAKRPRKTRQKKA